MKNWSRSKKKKEEEEEEEQQQQQQQNAAFNPHVLLRQHDCLIYIRPCNRPVPRLLLLLPLLLLLLSDREAGVRELSTSC
jgi:hypothetical protein